MDFAAIDFETANSSRGSVCSVGIVNVENGKITEQFANKQYEGQVYINIPDDGKVYKYVNNELVEDKLTEFQKNIQYQHDSFNEYAKEIVYQIQYNTALGNTTLVTTLQGQLQAEQQ